MRFANSQPPLAVGSADHFIPVHLVENHLHPSGSVSLREDGRVGLSTGVSVSSAERKSSV